MDADNASDADVDVRVLFTDGMEFIGSSMPSTLKLELLPESTLICTVKMLLLYAEQ